VHNGDTILGRRGMRGSRRWPAVKIDFNDAQEAPSKRKDNENCAATARVSHRRFGYFRGAGLHSSMIPPDLGCRL